MDIDAIQMLYLANADGTSYPLHPAPYEVNLAEGLLRIFAEIDPIRMMTLSRLNLREFGARFTNPDNALAVPRMLYLQVTLDIPAFLTELEGKPFMPPPLEGIHPSKLRNAILELQKQEHKLFKGTTLNTTFTNESYRRIRHGFMFKDQHKEKFFPVPPLKEIENNNLKFYRGI